MSKILASAVGAVTLVTAGVVSAMQPAIPVVPRQPIVQPSASMAQVRPTATPIATPTPAPWTPPPPRFIATPSVSQGPTGGLMGGLQMQTPKSTIGIGGGELRAPVMPNAPATPIINNAAAVTAVFPAVPAQPAPDRTMPSPTGGIPGSSNNIVR